jgi:tetratricopeptide (TPR) repeat protein
MKKLALASLLVSGLAFSCSSAQQREPAVDGVAMTDETTAQAGAQTPAEEAPLPADPFAEAQPKAEVLEAAPMVTPPSGEAGDFSGRLVAGEAIYVLRDLEASVERSTFNRNDHLKLVNLYIRTGQKDRAETIVRGVLEKDPADLEALRYLTRIYLLTGRAEQGLDDIKKRVEATPDDLARQALVLRLMIASGRQNQAITQTRDLLRKDEVNVELMKTLAAAYLSLGKFKTAEYILKRAMDLAPPDVDTLYMLANIRKNTSKNKSQIVEAFRAVANAQPDNAEAHNNLGLQYYETRNFQNAADEFDLAVKLAPGLVESQLNLGNAYKALQQYEKSRDTYLQVLSARPNYDAAYFNLGILYFENEFGGESRSALLARAVEYFEAYRKAVGAKLSPQDPVNQYIAEARDLIQQIAQADKEETEARTARLAKFEALEGKANEKLSKMETLEEQLKFRVKIYTDKGDVPNTERFEALVSEFADQYTGSLQALREAMNNKDGDEVQGVMEDFAFADEDFLPRAEEALAEPLPEGVAPATTDEPPETIEVPAASAESAAAAAQQTQEMLPGLPAALGDEADQPAPEGAVPGPESSDEIEPPAPTEAAPVEQPASQDQAAPVEEVAPVEEGAEKATPEGGEPVEF